MYEPAIIDEVKLMCEDFSITIIQYVRSSILPLRACEWALVAGLGVLLLGSGVSFLSQAVSPRSMTPRNMKMYFSFIRSFVMRLVIY